MNGYGSHRNPNKPIRLSAIQTITKTVIHTRNWGVPINRANFSANVPNSSVSNAGILKLRGALGWSKRSVIVLPPVLGQQVIEQIVDGHSAHQTVVFVNNGHGDQVVGGHPQ